MRRPQFLLALLLPRPAHALRDYQYPIARAALAHASSTRGPCTAWQHGACSSYAQSHAMLTRTSRSRDIVRIGCAYQPSALRTCLRHRAAGAPLYVHVPASGVPYVCVPWHHRSHEDLAVYEQFFSVPSENPEAPGVFVEMGALDGVTLSNTLAFERSRMNWTGDQANVKGYPLTNVEDRPDTAETRPIRPAIAAVAVDWPKRA